MYYFSIFKQKVEQIMIKTNRISVLFFAVLCLTAFPVKTISQETTITINAHERLQQFEGWGTSLCWWAVLVGKWDEANRTAFVNALVDPDTGLGYNIFRYNIGGGDQPSHDHLTKGSGGAKVPGFKPTENGQYDWAADPTQRQIALDINERCENVIFEAFSNSPPWWMTKSGCVSGNTNGADNLKEDYFDDFADYLSEVAKHYKDTWNITFRTIEPFNEPGAGWWTPNGGQEGCGFKNNQSKMIIELGKALVNKNLFGEIGVSAADESSIEQALSSLNGYSSEALGYLTQVNTHSYSGHNSRAKLASKAESIGKRLWQSESGPLHKNDDSNIALWMADIIIKDLRDLKAQAWIDWQVSDPAENWMSINADHSKQKFTYKSRFYMHSTFSRFIRPGSQIISSDNDNTVAALTKDNKLVVVVRNGTSAEQSHVIDVSSFDNIGTTVNVHRFSLPGNLTQLDNMQLPSNKRLSIKSPAQTITTYVFHDASLPPCTPSATVSYVAINDQSWEESYDVTLNLGDSIKIGPHPYEGGFWSWEGPQDFKSNIREITLKNVTKSFSGEYIGTFVNSSGCSSSVVVKVNVDDPSSAKYQMKEPPRHKTKVYMQNNDLVVSAHESPLTVQIFSLRGALIYKKSISGQSKIPLSTIIPYGNYIVHVNAESGNFAFQKKLFIGKK